MQGIVSRDKSIANMMRSEIIQFVIVYAILANSVGAFSTEDLSGLDRLRESVDTFESSEGIRPPNDDTIRRLVRKRRGLSLLESIFRFKKLGKKKKVKAAYKDTFYNNEGWEVRHPPGGSGLWIPSNYLPNPTYGVIDVMLLPPPTPPPFSKFVSPQLSNFAGYVGPVVADDDGSEFIPLEM